MNLQKEADEINENACQRKVAKLYESCMYEIWHSNSQE